MKTIVFYDKEKIGIEEVEIPKVPKDKILLKVNSCAICTWEQRVYTGEKKVEHPFIGGHEIAGEIVAIGENSTGNWTIGQTVVYGTNLACGHCYYCRMGEEQNCLHFDHSKQQYGLPYKGMGGLSQYLVVDPAHIFSYHSVSAYEASLTEPVSCVIHSLESAAVRFGDYVLVVGCGIMGMLHIQLAKKKGAIIIASDPNEERLLLAKELGADYIIQPQKENLQEKIQLYTEELGAQFIFNTTPIPSVIEELPSCLAPTGSLILYSSLYPAKNVPVALDSIHKQGQKIIGTANSNAQDFIRASRLISQGVIDMKPFITRVFTLNQIQEAFEEAVHTDAFRVVIDFTKESGELEC